MEKAPFPLQLQETGKAVSQQWKRLQETGKAVSPPSEKVTGDRQGYVPTNGKGYRRQTRLCAPLAEKVTGKAVSPLVENMWKLLLEALMVFVFIFVSCYRVLVCDG